jgi:DNA-binding GntR family transcriptional regulator
MPSGEASANREDRDEILTSADAANTQFHETVINQAGSPKLVWLFNIGVRFVPRSVFYSEDYESSRAAVKNHPSVVDHHAILDALRQEDPDKAREAMVTHISHASQLLIKHLERVGLWADDADDPQADSKSVQAGASG